MWEYKQRKLCAESFLIALMMEMELVSETFLEFMNHLTWLSAKGSFPEFCCCEDFKTYIPQPDFHMLQGIRT
jgi:hypothetical protein